MSENLRTTSFSNGDEITLIGSSISEDTVWAKSVTPARSVFRGNTENVEDFGYLYNFYAVEDARGICPEGWRVPSEEDWKQMEIDAGMPEADLERDGWAGADQNAAGKLKSLSSDYWDSPNEGATNGLGFSWVAGSTRYAYGSFEAASSLKVFGSLWSSGTLGENAYRRLVRFNRKDIRRTTLPKSSGIGLRCVTAKTSVNAEENGSLPKDFQLEQNFPNPFNPVTQIEFQLPQQSHIHLAVYDMLGREVTVLVNGNLKSGIHQVSFDASLLSSGMYMYRLSSDAATITKRMTLIK